MASYSEKFQELLKEGSHIGMAARFQMFMATFLTMPILVLLRRNFGERYFNFFMMVLYVVGLCVLPSIIGDGTGNRLVWWSVTGLLATLTVYHALMIWKRNRNGQRWHSRYDGDVLPIFKILPGSDAATRMFYEPLFVLLIGIALHIESSGSFLGYWFYFASSMMVFLERLNQSAARDLYLNAVDAQIESQHMDAALEGERVKDTEGFIVRGISDVSVKKRERMVNAMKKGIDKQEAAEASRSAHVVMTPPPVPKPVSKPQGESV